MRLDLDASRCQKHERTPRFGATKTVVRFIEVTRTMDYIQQLRALAERIPKQTERLTSKAATSQALVMPFVQALGYNPFDPGETVPQFDVDLGGGKVETVDYALVQDEVPIVIIDVKKWDTKLSDLHTSRLYRCFPVADARFAILTNGIEFRIYSDVAEPNRMDRKPYYTFSLLDLDDSVLSFLEPFTRGAFDYNLLLDNAETLSRGEPMVATAAPVAAPAAEPRPSSEARETPLSGPATTTADFDESGDPPQAEPPQKARVRRAGEAATSTPEDEKQTVLQMQAIDPSQFDLQVPSRKKSKRKMLKPSTFSEALERPDDLVEAAKRRKETVRPAQAAETEAPAKPAAKKKPKKQRRRTGFSETQWFMQGVKSDAEVLEATTSNEKYEHRDDLSDEERRKYSLRTESED